MTKYRTSNKQLRLAQLTVHQGAKVCVRIATV